MLFSIQHRHAHRRHNHEVPWPDHRMQRPLQLHAVAVGEQVWAISSTRSDNSTDE